MEKTFPSLTTSETHCLPLSLSLSPFMWEGRRKEGRAEDKVGGWAWWWVRQATELVKRKYKKKNIFLFIERTWLAFGGAFCCIVPCLFGCDLAFSTYLGRQT